MTRNESASYWADTALSYFETMARQQEQTLAPLERRPHRNKLPLLTASPEIVAAIAACDSGRKASVKPSPVAPPPAENFSAD